MLNRKDAVQQVAAYKDQIADFLGVNGKCMLGVHTFPVVFTDIRLARQADLKHKPDKRNNKSPLVVQLITPDEDTIDIILEDIISFTTALHGFTIKTEGVNIVYTSGNP